MKLRDSSVELLKQVPGNEGCLKHIELCGRICYNSLNKITETSHKKFIDSLIESRHFSVLEHGEVTLYISFESDLDRPYYEKHSLLSFFQNNPYSKVVERCVVGSPRYFITTNYRVIVENGLLSALRYRVAPLPDHARRQTVKVVTNIGVTREFNRHRCFSISEQSTRFCNFSSDKFDKSVSVLSHAGLQPNGRPFNPDLSALIGDINNSSSWNSSDFYRFAYLVSEFCYLNLVQSYTTPQQARRVLSLDTVSEVVYTAFVDDWYDFFDKRVWGITGKPHPDAFEVASKIFKEFLFAGLISEDYLEFCKEQEPFDFIVNS